AVGLHMIAQNLFSREASEIESRLRGQGARIRREEVSAGRQHVTASARRRARRSTRDPAPIERGDQRVALCAGTRCPGRVRFICLKRLAAVYMHAVLDREILEVAQPGVDLAQGLVGPGLAINAGFTREAAALCGFDDEPRQSLAPFAIE